MLINNLKNIRGIIKHLFNDTPITPLGRWKISDSNINLHIDYSNEDHCGTCSQYVFLKYNEECQQNNEEKNKYNNDYLYQFESMNTHNPSIIHNKKNV